jgi:hypothetical protein
MSIELNQSTQFKVKKLEIITKFGNINLSNAFQEINIYDSMFMPCIRGEILIQDSVGILNRLLIDGSEFIRIAISKADESSDTLYDRTFKIYKVSNRKNVNQNSEIYLLHFISEEMIYSMQQKIRQSFTGQTYTGMAVTILVNYLKVTGDKIGFIDSTQGLHTHVIPNLSPFDALNWIVKKALNEENLPNFLFFENKKGYCFVSLTSLIKEPPLFDINFNPKNIKDIEDSSFLGARDMKIVSQFDFLQNVEGGVYAGKFIGIDPITRQVRINRLDYQKTYNRTKYHLNKFPNFSGSKNRLGLDAAQMFDSKVSLYPFESTRADSPYIKTNSNQEASIIDKTHSYVFQRMPILTNLLQTTIHLTMPGNFALSSGYTVNLNVPRRTTKVDDGNNFDESLTGKYIITASHQIIRPDKHETVIEVATDSTNKPFVINQTTYMQEALSQ